MPHSNETLTTARERRTAVREVATADAARPDRSPKRGFLELIEEDDGHATGSDTVPSSLTSPGAPFE